MVTPSKAQEEEALHSKHITVGRWVQYSSGRITRTGKVTQVLKTEEETPHPPKVVYVCEQENGEMKEYTNNPSKLEVVPHHK